LAVLTVEREYCEAVLELGEAVGAMIVAVSCLIGRSLYPANCAFHLNP
jgi:hypothetical protein